MPTDDPTPLRVLYVGGWMRSGTTLLCEMLGAFENVLALGEVSGIWRALARGQACACGTKIDACPVWGPALADVVQRHGIGPEGYAAMAELTKRVLRTRAALSLSRLSGTSEATWPPDVRRYVEVMRTLLTSVARHAKAQAVVDSSKLPPGFLTLQLIPDARVEVIHIVRDARAVANSELKTRVREESDRDILPPGRSVFQSVFLWSGFNLAVWIFGSHANSYRAIRYENLTRAPDQYLDSLSRDLDLSRRSGPLLDGRHIAVGNPARFQGSERAVRTDEEWVTNLPRHTRAFLSVVAAPAGALLALFALRDRPRRWRSRARG